MSSRISFLDLAASHRELRPALDQRWCEIVGSSGFVGGEAVDHFERDFANYCGATQAIGVANGTDALELILQGLGIGGGDEVIVPSNTFIATAEAVVRCGATPVYVDVDPATALVDDDIVRAALTPHTAAVMAVHLYGQAVDVAALRAVTDPAGVMVIEDAAQAHGARSGGRRVGSLGVAAAFSFYPGKNLGALGDGGAVTTDDPVLAANIRSMANHGRSIRSRYEHDLVGRNSRLDGLQAAFLRVKLGHLDEWNVRRRVVAGLYRELLPDRFSPFTVTEPSAHAFHLFVVRCAMDRELVGKALSAADIDWGIHYPVPCHQQAPYRAEAGLELAVVEELAGEIISLPMHPHLDAADVERVCEVLGDVAHLA